MLTEGRKTAHSAAIHIGRSFRGRVKRILPHGALLQASTLHRDVLLPIQEVKHPAAFLLCPLTSGDFSLHHTILPNQ